MHRILIALSVSLLLTSGASAATSKLESLGEPGYAWHIPDSGFWPQGHLLYGEAITSTGYPDTGHFYVYNVQTRQTIFSGANRTGNIFRCIAVDKKGNALPAEQLWVFSL